MALFGMIVCLAAIIAIIILAGLKIKSKWLAIIAAVVLSCVVMMPFSCCAGKWYKKHKEQVKIERAAEKKAAEQAEKAKEKAEQLPDKSNL
ncbi:MAG: hypothetical protein IKO95_00315 [Spirochaetia bacterium]|nr:hypothetical protein [Spirochaetia bacterium]